MRHVGEGDSGGTLPRARASLLRGTYDREGREREDRQTRTSPVPLPPPRRQGVPARRRARGRSVLGRHHQAERQRGAGTRPHAARARAKGVERVARSKLRKSLKQRRTHTRLGNGAINQAGARGHNRYCERRADQGTYCGYG